MASADQLAFGVAIAPVDTSAFTVEGGEQGTTGAAAPGYTCNAPGGGTTTNRGLAHTAWYRFVGTGGPITLSTVGSTFDTVVAVHPGSAGGTVTPDLCNDDGGGTAGFSSLLTFTSTDRTTYYVQVGRYCFYSAGGDCTPPPAAGTLSLLVTNSSAPPNDARSAATPLTSSASPNNSFASEEPGEVLQCPNQGPNHNITRNYAKTLWYAFTAPANGTATFRAGGGVDTVAAVYAGNASTFLDCNDDDGTGTLTSRLSIPVTQGTTYYLQVGGFNGSKGPFAVSVDFVAAPPAPQGGGGSGGGGGGGTTQPRTTPQPKVSLTVILHATYVKVSEFPVSGAPVGSTIVLRCSSKKTGCGTFRKKTIKVRSTKRVSLTKYVSKLKLRKGARLTVAITKPGLVGSYTVFTIRKGKNPKKQSYCLVPGSTKPRKLGTCG